MDVHAFEASLRTAGFTDIAPRDLPPGHATEPHSHPFDVRALVTAGHIVLTVDGTQTAYNAGDIFAMAHGCEHTETVGAGGVSFLAGRRHPA